MFDFSVYDASESASAILQGVDSSYNAPIAFVANTIIFVIINYSSLLGVKRRLGAHESEDEDAEWGAQDHELRGVNVLPRSQLPSSLQEWRILVASLLSSQSAVKPVAGNPWSHLSDFFAKKGGLQLSLPRQRALSVWNSKQPHAGSSSSSTAITAMPVPVSGQEEHRNTNKTGLTCYARTTQGKEVVVRLVKCKSEGKQHLKILRHLRKDSLRLHEIHHHQNAQSHHHSHSSAFEDEHILEHAHVLPMLFELVFHDLVFGVFPRVDTTLVHVLGKDVTESSLSVGDALDVLIQALEAIVYIHRERIAHQNLFLSNFLLEWQPTAESLHSTSATKPTKPRVYLTGFDDAVIFPGDMRAQDMRIPKHSEPAPAEGQPLAPELDEGDVESNDDTEYDEDEPGLSSYCPFTMDVWQFGQDLADFDCGIPEVASIFKAMGRRSTSHRIFAIEALERVQKIIKSQYQEVLLRPLLPALLDN
ncbi:hypothetical protein BJ165DRAFT_1418413 [Panaeolus papilionaceus]|nr:hypothetical protein BJ165DRAFT_1418413 [Panaeolus papilionaceus]